MYKYLKILGIMLLPLVGCGPVNKHQTPLVGADRDVHGCIGSAGYTWCASKKKCLRLWIDTCE